MGMNCEDDALKIEKQIDEEYNQSISGENSPKNLQEAIEIMVESFHKYSKEELERQSRNIDLEMVFRKVKECFQQEYGFSCDSLGLNNLFQKDVTSFMYYGAERHPSFVHIDELLESSVLMFLLAVFKWSKESEDTNLSGQCFSYLMFLFNEMVITGELPDLNAKRWLMQIIGGDDQILQLATDCYWTIIAFNMAHETAHYYFTSIGRDYRENKPQEEFDADGVAYHIVLQCIMHKALPLEEYSYLAPMMYMDFSDMYVYEYALLHGVVFPDTGYPSFEKRKEELFSIVDKDIYVLNTEEGNALYGCFSDVMEEFKKQATQKMEKGYFDNIIKK